MKNALNNPLPRKTEELEKQASLERDKGEKHDTEREKEIKIPQRMRRYSQKYYCRGYSKIHAGNSFPLVHGLWCLNCSYCRVKKIMEHVYYDFIVKDRLLEGLVNKRLLGDITTKL
ncbi:2546_t:CDS:2, partial [Gigaspora rosea]